MSIPAGWYDDGSGRQRWWDGSQWTDDYAPAGESAPAAAGASAPAAPKQAPAIGFIGLGLAVLGTILACIPNIVTFGFASTLLLAGFVISLIAVFKKRTTKWPSIVGIALSIIGGIIGVIVLIITLLSNIPTSALPSPPSTPSTSEQPSAPPATGDDEGRPSSEAIGDGWRIGLNAHGYHQYDDNPEFFACVGEYFYDSDLSDEALRDIALGQDIDTDAERTHAAQLGADATAKCDPIPQ